MLQKLYFIFFDVTLRAGLFASSPRSFAVTGGFSLQSLTLELGLKNIIFSSARR